MQKRIFLITSARGHLVLVSHFVKSLLRQHLVRIQIFEDVRRVITTVCCEHEAQMKSCDSVLQFTTLKPMMIMLLCQPPLVTGSPNFISSNIEPNIFNFEVKLWN